MFFSGHECNLLENLTIFFRHSSLIQFRNFKNRYPNWGWSKYMSSPSLTLPTCRRRWRDCENWVLRCQAKKSLKTGRNRPFTLPTWRPNIWMHWKENGTVGTGNSFSIPSTLLYILLLHFLSYWHLYILRIMFLLWLSVTDRASSECGKLDTVSFTN